MKINGKHNAEVTFGRLDDEGRSSIEMQNDSPKEAHRVIGTVRHIVKQHAAAHPDVHGINFSGVKSDGGRDKLYTKLTKQAGGSSNENGKHQIYVKEVFDNPHPFEEAPAKFKHSHIYSFDHKGTPFHVSIHTPFIEGDAHEVLFSPALSRNFQLTNQHPHDAHKILSTVKAVMAHHAKKHNVVGYTFSGDKGEPSRDKLYQRIAKKFGGTSSAEKFDNYHTIPVK